MISAEPAMKKIKNPSGCNKIYGMFCATTMPFMDIVPAMIMLLTTASARGIS